MDWAFVCMEFPAHGWFTARGSTVTVTVVYWALLHCKSERFERHTERYTNDTFT